jgi:predicted ATPase
MQRGGTAAVARPAASPASAHAHRHLPFRQLRTLADRTLPACRRPGGAARRPRLRPAGRLAPARRAAGQQGRTARRGMGPHVVEEGNLHVQISTLRKVLGAAALTTVPGQGYRFNPHGAPLPEASAAPAPRAAVPADPRLVGRDDDLAALRDLLAGHDLVTLVGPGGIGKTRLARAVLAELAASQADGAAVVELAALSDAAFVPGAIAAALRLPLPSSGDALAALAQRRWDRCAWCCWWTTPSTWPTPWRRQLQALRLAAAPGMRWLVTSQVPLALDEEQVYRLGGLALAGRGRRTSRRRAAAAPIALFSERLRAADRHFVLDAGNLALVAQICRELDGIPLALELAAARCPLLGLQGVRAAPGGPAAPAALGAAPRTDAAADLAGRDGLEPHAARRRRRARVPPAGGVQRGVHAGARDPGAGSGRASTTGPASTCWPSWSTARWSRWCGPLRTQCARVRSRGTGCSRPAAAYALEKLEASGDAQTARQRHGAGAAAALRGRLGRRLAAARGRVPGPSRGGARQPAGRARLGRGRTMPPARWRWPVRPRACGAACRCTPRRLRRCHSAARCIDSSTTPVALAARLWEGIAQLSGEIASADSRAAAEHALQLYTQAGDRARPVPGAGPPGVQLPRRDTAEARAAFARMQALEDPGWPPALRLYGRKVAGGLASDAGELDPGARGPAGAAGTGAPGGRRTRPQCRARQPGRPGADGRRRRAGLRPRPLVAGAAGAAADGHAGHRARQPGAGGAGPGRPCRSPPRARPNSSTSPRSSTTCSSPTPPTRWRRLAAGEQPLRQRRRVARLCRRGLRGTGPAARAERSAGARRGPRRGAGPWRRNRCCWRSGSAAKGRG